MAVIKCIAQIVPFEGENHNMWYTRDGSNCTTLVH